MHLVFAPSYLIYHTKNVSLLDISSSILYDLSKETGRVDNNSANFHISLRPSIWSPSNEWSIISINMLVNYRFAINSWATEECLVNRSARKILL